MARRVGAKHPHATSLLALTAPLVVVWSVWFIPQAYLLLMALPLLFLDLNVIVVMILLTFMLIMPPESPKP